MDQRIIDKRNRYALEGDEAVLSIVRRDGSELTVRIDAQDIHRMRRELWRALPAKGGFMYAYNGAGEPLHHFILRTDRSLTKIDFVNGDTLDCRSENLKKTRRGAKVTYRKSDGAAFFRRDPLSGEVSVSIYDGGKRRHVGTYSTAEAAFAAWHLKTCASR